MAVQQVTPTICPSCHTQFNAPIQSLIDGQNQHVKMAFLQGRINIAQCPQCRNISSIQTSILYYDLEKELALVYVPGGLNVAIEAQEKAIGDLTNTLFNQLEPKKRKLYILNPKQFLKLETMFDTILEADGITKEIRQTQEDRLKLLQDLATIKTPSELKTKAEEHKEELDRTFFEVLTNMAQVANVEGNPQLAQHLITIRPLLAEISGIDSTVIDDVDAKLGLIILKDKPDLLKRLREARNEQMFVELIATGHAMLDYEFFQDITKQIDGATDQGNHKQAAELKELRTKILETKSVIEEENKKAFEAASDLLQKIFQSSNPQQVLSENLDKINQPFFSLLSAQAQQAQQQNQPEAAQAMEVVMHMAMSMLQERAAQEAQQSASETTTPEPPPAKKPTPKIHIAGA
ncbi:CpXC domain-containing protein [Anaerolineales bacterium HSG24]|nr:CpXC domain-containing protein [Anaerolineales bacterium HSG24]